jgi:3-(3-hydroxy-phenyl)propionate hydroxylase
MRDPEELEARVRAMRDNPRDFAPPNPPLGPGFSSAYGKGRIGWQFPQPVVGGKLMDEHLGHAFALIYADGFLDQAAIEYLATWYPLLRPIALEGDAARILREQYQVGAALLRPDRYVHALASTWDQLVDILATVPVRQAMQDSSFGSEIGRHKVA